MNTNRIYVLIIGEPRSKIRFNYNIYMYEL